MMRSKYLIFLATIAALFAIPSIASANTPDVAATTIPASACRPENDTTDSRVFLSNGAYVFNQGVTGTVNFYCPLPINGNRTNGIGSNSLSRYNVYYRDPDATANRSAITTQLLYRYSDGLAPQVGALWSSNTVNTGSNLTANRIEPILLNHTFATYRLYFFVVTMTRTTTTLNPAFSGIDFSLPISG